jgi:hypothetical protein
MQEVKEPCDAAFEICGGASRAEASSARCLKPSLQRRRAQTNRKSRQQGMQEVSEPCGCSN